MTVCIAALCADSQKVVVCSDRMVTAAYPPVEFEHGVPKMDRIAEACVALSSGDALAHAGVCRLAVNNLGGLVRPQVQLMTEEIKRSYLLHRNRRIEERFLSPRGWTWDGFYGGRVIVPPDLMALVDSQISTFDYGVSFVIAGTDPDAGHIYGLRHPGEVDCYDSLGYHAIGIGAMHALSTLIANGYTSALDSRWATYFVYEAKKNAESAPGVGSMTDIGVIDDKGLFLLADDDVDVLDSIYKQRNAPTNSDAVKKLVNDLSFGE